MAVSRQANVEAITSIISNRLSTLYSKFMLVTMKQLIMLFELVWCSDLFMVQWWFVGGVGDYVISV